MHAAQEPSPASAPGRDPSAVDARWQDPSRAATYAGERFAGRHRGRDARLVTRLVRRFDGDATARSVLDVPAGAGRLHDALAALATSTCGADVSPAMLAHATYATEGRALVTDAAALPFDDDAFDVVVACRLLHHLDDDALRRAVAELSRVARRLVVASYWDACSWTEARKRWGLRARTDARRSVPRAQFAAIVAEAGGSVLGHAASFRFVSPQTFAAWRP